MNLPPIYDLLLGIQMALINAVTPELRAVIVDIDTDKTEILFFFFYDCAITEELFDLSSVAIAEVDMHPLQYFFRDQIIPLKLPHKLPSYGRFAYLRKEPNLPVFKKEDRTFLLKETFPIVVLLLNMQEALLGRVTPQLRHVSVGINSETKQLECSFIYDGEISEENFNLAAAAVSETSATFPEYRVDSFIERIDSPQDFNAEGRRAAYMRKEFKS